MRLLTASRAVTCALVLLGLVSRSINVAGAAAGPHKNDISAFLARLEKVWPKGWHVETRTEGKVAPLYWPAGEGTYLVLCRKGAKTLAKAGREGGELRLWIMEPDYAATGVVPTGDAQQAPSPTEIDKWGDRRVFAWGSVAWSAGVPGTAWPTVRDDLKAAMNEAHEPAWGEADVEYYRKRHAAYRNHIMDAVKARDKEWLLRDTQRFNDSVSGELLVAQVVSMADPAHPEVLFYKPFVVRELAAIAYDAGADKVHVTRLKDAVQVESNANPDGTWPDDLRIMLLFKLPARLQLSIEAARKEYTPGTPILVRITLHNADAEPYVLTRPLPEGAPPAPMRGLGWGSGLYIYSAREAEDFKELPRDAPHGDSMMGPGYMPVYRFEGRLEPGGRQSILQFIRKPAFPAGVRRFQAVLYLRGRKIETPETAVEIREAAEQDPATFTAEERRIINGNVASLHNTCYGNRQLARTRLKVLPVVRKALDSDERTLDCEYALYIGVLQGVETRDATPDDVALAKQAGEALLERFPDSWLAGPVRAMLTAANP
ncbi:MAG TPA: hypothetical protein VMZ92_03530 [Planctomycetota bacterium]|nr:hypothetical protein [Planctomycetota bacterium]